MNATTNLNETLGEWRVNSSLPSPGQGVVYNMGYARKVASWQTIFVGVCLSPIIVLGIMGNMFSLLVWVKGRRRKTSTARYLSGLAIADIAVLSTTALEFWVGYVLHHDLMVTDGVLCKFLSYMAFLGPSVSAWILVAVTVERALSVWIPHRINIVCRQTTAVAMIGLLIVVLAVLYLPVPLGMDVVTVILKNVSWMECNIVSTSMYRKYFDVWLYLDMCLFFIIPFVIILVCNFLILIKVMTIASKRNGVFQAGGQRAATGKSKRMIKTVTKRIVILSVTFCICNAPLAVLNVLLTNSDAIVRAEDVQTYRIPFHILMFLNNGINFFLYCVIGSGFRKDLVGIFRPSSRTSTTR